MKDKADIPYCYGRLLRLYVICNIYKILIKIFYKQKKVISHDWINILFLSRDLLGPWP